MNNDAIWQAIEDLAAMRRISCSRLAQLGGLDATTFNKSKRYTPDGKPRWPSLSSVAKVLRATGTTWEEFVRLIPRDDA